MKNIAVIALGLTLFSCTKVAEFQGNATTDMGLETRAGTQIDEYPSVPNELLIQFKEGVSAEQKGNVFKSLGASVKENIHTNAMKRFGKTEGVYLIKCNLNAIEARKKLGIADVIDFVEPNYIYQHSVLTNDPVTNGLWGLTGSFGINAHIAWDKVTGSKSVYIGIIDEGVMFEHIDLSANMGTNPGEIPADRIDNDNNGLVDDVHGYDFANSDASIYDGPDDDHGTHVAGTIGAVGNNGIGLVGVNWNVSLLNAKFLGAGGGTSANAIKAVDYFTNLKSKGVNIVATNNSWGGGGYTQALYDAIERANKAGILFIAAAGNSGINIDKRLSYPAAYQNTNIIAVAAIDINGYLARFSNYGVKNVDIGAPGVNINSTIPSNTYGSNTGTSMAAPHVTGACALYAAKYPTATAAQIKAAILNNGIPTTSLTGKVATGKRLNVSTF